MCSYKGQCVYAHLPFFSCDHYFHNKPHLMTWCKLKLGQLHHDLTEKHPGMCLRALSLVFTLSGQDRELVMQTSPWRQSDSGGLKNRPGGGWAQHLVLQNHPVLFGNIQTWTDTGGIFVRSPIYYVWALLCWVCVWFKAQCLISDLLEWVTLPAQSEHPRWANVTDPIFSRAPAVQAGSLWRSLLQTSELARFQIPLI